MTLRTTFNRLRRRWLRRWIWQPVFGEQQGGRLLPNTRISSASVIEHEDRLVLGDNVFIGAFNFIEASGGITIEEGVQVTSHSAIVTHSSHRSQRLLGPAYTTCRCRRAANGRAGSRGRSASARTASSDRIA